MIRFLVAGVDLGKVVKKAAVPQVPVKTLGGARGANRPAWQERSVGEKPRNVSLGLTGPEHGVWLCLPVGQGSGGPSKGAGVFLAQLEGGVGTVRQVSVRRLL